MTSTYARYIPAPPLDAYIDYFFYLDGSMTFPREKSLPIPAAVLIINFSGAVQICDPNQNQMGSTWSDAWWMGTWNTYHLVEWPQHIQQVGVTFKPEGAYPFLKIPVSELHNQYVSLDHTWGQAAGELRERLYAAPTIEAKFALLEQLLLARLSEASHGFKTVQHAVEKIVELGGLLSIKTLSDQIGISQNHLLTQFNRMVGFSPKELARHCRLWSVLRSTDPAQTIDWTQVAQHFGYYDLSHLNKDFVAFTGHNPTHFLKLLRQKHNDNPLHLYLPRLLPID